MKVRTIVSEDFTNYKVPAMFIGCTTCDFKCCTDGGFSPSVCINNLWKDSEIHDVDDDAIIKEYLSNPITSAIVFGLFEPFMQFYEIHEFIDKFRNEYECNDDIVIYTGYNETEVLFNIGVLSQYKNIIVKFGRYMLNQEKHFDEVLGVWLASDNQHAIRISKENAQ